MWYDVTFTAEATPMALIVTTIAESGVENRVFVDNLKIQVINLVSWFEGFEGFVFPPVGWMVKHISGSKEWTRSTLSFYKHKTRKLSMCTGSRLNSQPVHTCNFTKIFFYCL